MCLLGWRLQILDVDCTCIHLQNKVIYIANALNKSWNNFLLSFFHSTFFKWLIKWYNYLFMLRSPFTWHIRRVISKMQYSWWDSKTRIEDPSQRWDPAYKIWDPKCGTQELRWGTNPRGGTWSPRPWNCNWGHKTWDIRHAWDLRP